ncbi:MAG: hypothetical protein ACE5I2_07215 [Anaerolineae bacterium]
MTPHPRGIEATFSPQLPISEDMTHEEILKVLRINALSAHQIAVGRGDELVQLLKRAVHNMEVSHSRIQWLSIIFFAFGLGVMLVGVYFALFGTAGKEVWGTILGVSGGLGSLVSLFYTTPLDKISRSVNNLIQLETAFLGYIRVVGEVDSAFQWQYIETMDGSGGHISDVLAETTKHMKETMTYTMDLIDRYCAEDSESLQELCETLESMKTEFDDRLKQLETKTQDS